MKKIFSLSILIFIICLGSSCFGYTRTVDDLEEKLKCFGYGEINFEEYTFVPSSSFVNTYDSLISSLNSKDYYIVIYKYWDSDRGKYDNSKFYFVLQNKLNFYKEKTYFYISGLYSSNVKLVDTSNKTLSFCNNLSVKTLFPDSFFIASGDVSEEEFNDINYQINCINNFLVYSEADILLGNTIIWDAYKASITESSYDNIDYKGSINYLDSTNAASITYTSGFEENTYYDLFFEEYRLDNTLETGITEYPTLTIDLGDVTTSNKNVSLAFNSFNLSSMNVYRLCVGINNDDIGEKNTILLSTDWLCFNSNTLINYPVFSKRNYVILLNKVEFDLDYDDSIYDDDSNGNENDNDDIINDSFIDSFIPPATGQVAYFIKAPQSYLYNERYSLCTIFLPNDWSFEDIYLVINKYDSNDNILERSIIQNYNNSSADNVIFTKLESGFWSCNLADWYDFDTDSDVWYTVSLYSYEDGLLDSSRAFYFNLDMTPDNPKEDNDDLLNYDNTDFNGLINSSKSWVSNIFGFLNIFPSWFVTCIIGSITVVVICRILGR